jgi:hypothetical protein
MAQAKRVLSTPRRTTSKSDPIFKLIEEATRRLIEFKHASEEEASIRQKIGENNCRRSHVSLPTRFNFCQGHSYAAVSPLEYDNKLFAKRAKDSIEESRRFLKKKGVSPEAAKSTRSSIACWTREIQERKEAKEWLADVLKRDQARLNKLWRRSGYGNASSRVIAAEAAATDAITVVSKATPGTFEGAVALMKYVADRALYSDSDRRGLPFADVDAEICAPLYRAHDLVHMWAIAPSAA